MNFPMTETCITGCPIIFNDDPVIWYLLFKSKDALDSHDFYSELSNFIATITTSYKL